MNKVAFMICIVLAGMTMACSTEPSIAPATHATFALPTLIPPRVPLSSSPTSTLIPTAPTALPVEGAAVTGTLPLTRVAPTASTRSRTATPTMTVLGHTPTPVVASGLYVTDLRTDPPPVRGTELKFHAQFLNSTEREQNYRWLVYIFRADTQRGIGETTRTNSAIPVGSSQQLSDGFWKLSVSGPCEYFYAQVGWINSEAKVVWFTLPSGALFQKALTMCPP